MGVRAFIMKPIVMREIANTIRNVKIRRVSLYGRRQWRFQKLNRFPYMGVIFKKSFKNSFEEEYPNISALWYALNIIETSGCW